MELDTAPDSTHHLLILSGSAKISANQQEQILKNNQSATFTAPPSIRIENTGKRPLALIEVQFSDPPNG